MPKPVAYKVQVTQVYDVYIFYGEGVVTDSGDERVFSDEVREIVFDDAIRLAFEEDGLVVRLHEETETSNGYVALVETFDPDTKFEYAIDKMPTRIEAALDAAFKQKKESNIAEK
jgi:hypothetical protein